MPGVLWAPPNGPLCKAAGVPWGPRGPRTRYRFAQALSLPASHPLVGRFLSLRHPQRGAPEEWGEYGSPEKVPPSPLEPLGSGPRPPGPRHPGSPPSPGLRQPPLSPGGEGHLRGGDGNHRKRAGLREAHRQLGWGEGLVNWKTVHRCSVTTCKRVDARRRRVGTQEPGGAEKVKEGEEATKAQGP